MSNISDKREQLMEEAVSKFPTFESEKEVLIELSAVTAKLLAQDSGFKALEELHDSDESDALRITHLLSIGAGLSRGQDFKLAQLVASTQVVATMIKDIEDNDLDGVLRDDD